MLENTRLLIPPARALLEAYPYDFLYGNISADIVVGKNLCEELKHCHNWKIGFKLLKRAETDSQTGFRLRLPEPSGRRHNSPQPLHPRDDDTLVLVEDSSPHLLGDAL